MTRINCVPVEELTDLHLLAEYRELPRVYKLVQKVIEKGADIDIPSNYRLGTGHVKFFYDKGTWLKRRFELEIVPELIKRGFKLNFKEYRNHPKGWDNDYYPTEEAISINRKRIKERLGGK